ncbi:hypothetical protein IU427_20665 [Nocardia beijingensis]|uniref:hypothetical protein n=1 Tax=Nocardia beijingensis TaxID=95162 RepID=UPI0018952459|nr:hypothetical protein [Nocardia beijingensis]MBF6467580.1 hypothetical protein [Nocardia beijingensis]
MHFLGAKGKRRPGVIAERRRYRPRRPDRSDPEARPRLLSGWFRRSRAREPRRALGAIHGLRIAAATAVCAVLAALACYRARVLATP